jgi:hypothetical protein
MEPIGGRIKALKEVRWYTVGASDEPAYERLMEVVKAAAGRDHQTEMERRAAIWTRKIRAVEAAQTGEQPEDDPFAGWEA